MKCEKISKKGKNPGVSVGDLKKGPICMCGPKEGYVFQEIQSAL